MDWAWGKEAQFQSDVPQVGLDALKTKDRNHDQKPKLPIQIADECV
jgi:hypothetical protein